MIFFDLDLLCDLIYVNIMLGITFASFTEMNFSLLMPFILVEYGFLKNQIATMMSILVGFDVFTRLTISFIANFIGWQNRTFFLVVLVHIQDFGVTLAIAVLIGAGKGLRTIFMALVISTHVLTSGIVALTLGPVVDWIRDVTLNYVSLFKYFYVFDYRRNFVVVRNLLCETKIKENRRKKTNVK
ncbi:hypothetical protein WN51_09978 [Melipona quadrifasciata]|uniref:Uncharacterized protein n=1 Tax=Melipona quadrifasciata TaxID=166423 RepID=A0A0M9ADH1_9HYME|nr:hypothetical protein WN51_09978 [Melipona quadrifasciata]